MPISRAATCAAFRVGVTTTNRCPAAASARRVSVEHGGLAGSRRALDNHQFVSAGEDSNGVTLGHVEPGIARYIG